MAGTSPVAAGISGRPTLPAATHADLLGDLAGAADGWLGLVAWVGGLLGVCLLARWWLTGADRRAASDVEFDPPALPPGEAYETALAFAESKQPLAERLADGGQYAEAIQVYEAILEACESAVQLSDMHGFDGESARARLSEVREALRQARRRKQFWRFSPRAAARGGRSGPSYEDLLDRGTSAESWADRLFEDGHYDSARSEYELAREHYERAIERARDHFKDPLTAESRLQTVETRIDRCGRQA